uniref:Uncharacterized protein n=1 Tax=Plectus sambesii TaxID=2011161 RepID=A0A914X4U1_9BILA
MLLIIFLSGFAFTLGQQVKITNNPLPVTSAQHSSQIAWAPAGSSATTERIYCVSDLTSQLRFVCVDCHKRNATDLEHVLGTAQDVTHSTGFPALLLTNVVVKQSWSGLTIICQARSFCRHTVDSPVSVINIQNGYGAVTRGQRRR